MSKIPDRRRGIVRGSFRFFGLAATAILLLATAPGQRAQALSLINPGAAPTAKYASDGLATEVRGRHGGGHGGGGFHRGGFRGGYRAGPALYRGGGYRYAGPGIVRHHHFAPRRAYWHHRHHFRPRYYGYAPYYYPQRHYYPRRYCRIVWTITACARLPLSPVASPLAPSPPPASSLPDLLVSCVEWAAEMNQAPARAPDGLLQAMIARP
jgi:hypothetical protein